MKWPGVDSGFGIRLLKPHWNRSRIRLRLALDCPESESESTTVGLRWSRNRLRLTGINYKSGGVRMERDEIRRNGMKWDGMERDKMEWDMMGFEGTY